MISCYLPICEKCQAALAQAPHPEDDHEKQVARAERLDVEHVAARCAVCGRWEDEQ